MVDVEPRSLEVVRGGDCRHYRAYQVKLIFECMSRHFILIGAVGPSPLDGEPAISDMDSSFGCQDRKSTRLNSSHVAISYAVFCLKKKKQASGSKMRQQL